MAALSPPLRDSDLLSLSRQHLTAAASKYREYRTCIYMDSYLSPILMNIEKTCQNNPTLSDTSFWDQLKGRLARSSETDCLFGDAALYSLRGFLFPDSIWFLSLSTF